MIKDENYKYSMPLKEIKDNEVIDSKDIVEQVKEEREETRYFNINLNVKCYNCGEIGHISSKCSHEKLILCSRCNKQGHMSYECPDVKCFKCNRLGHKSNDCREVDIQKCHYCENNGHIKLNCLNKNSYSVKNINRRFFSVNCHDCHGKDHFLCLFNFPILSGEFDHNVSSSESEDEEEELEGNSINKRKGSSNSNFSLIPNLSNEKISINTIFLCPICANYHPYSKICKEESNSFDKLRKQISSNDKKVTNNVGNTHQTNNQSNYSNQSKYNYNKNGNNNYSYNSNGYIKYNQSNHLNHNLSYNSLNNNSKNSNYSNSNYSNHSNNSNLQNNNRVKKNWLD